MIATAPSTGTPAAAPTRVRERLAAARGPVGFLHRGPLALYLEVEGWCVGVVGTSAAAVPCALRLATPGIGELATARTARVADGALFLDDTEVRVGRLVDVSAPRLTLDAPVTVDVGAARDLLAQELPTHALDALARAEPAAVAHLVGRGSGLTPSGDDVLCGWLATHWAAGVDVPGFARALAQTRHRTTTLSATLLDCARHGEVLPEFGRLLRVLAEPAAASAADRANAVDDLVGIGHTSGSALLLGVGLALASLSSAGPPAANTDATSPDTQRSRCA
ncbi:MULTISPECIES: oxamate carbamoyltransferase subunit AllH family protein [unclassified Nocardioides]|uniref:oxamate carbamoyltransferase subunit AllH family protein n=1 Tax=unclassified Nocardioides TaxID=2615069 RepID=UPI0019101AA3|nr:MULTISPECIES: DUF2877 domain-containing protein [unclassified Nocardioides]